MRTGGSGFVRLDGPSVLPTTLLADLSRLDATGVGADPLEVIAACVRHREAALLLFRCDGLVWPVTVFPYQMLYHSPRDLTQASIAALGKLGLLNAEPPGVQAPGHPMHERVAGKDSYRPLEPLLWCLALQGPRNTLLAELSGTAAYRAVKEIEDDGSRLSGAQRSAASRLRRESVPLREIAGWPGMSVERASRLLNGLYLASALIVTRAHPAARGQAGGLLGRLKRPRS